MPKDRLRSRHAPIGGHGLKGLSPFVQLRRTTKGIRTRRRTRVIETTDRTSSESSLARRPVQGPQAVPERACALYQSQGFVVQERRNRHRAPPAIRRPAQAARAEGRRGHRLARVAPRRCRATAAKSSDASRTIQVRAGAGRSSVATSWKGNPAWRWARCRSCGRSAHRQAMVRWAKRPATSRWIAKRPRSGPVAIGARGSAATVRVPGAARACAACRAHRDPSRHSRS